MDTSQPPGINNPIVFPSPVDVSASSDHVSCVEIPGLAGNVPGINATLKALQWIERLDPFPVP